MLKRFYLFSVISKKRFLSFRFYNFLNSLFELAGLISLSVIVLLILNPETYIDKLTNIDFYNFFSNKYNYLENINFSLYFFLLFF